MRIIFCSRILTLIYQTQKSQNWLWNKNKEDVFKILSQKMFILYRLKYKSY